MTPRIFGFWTVGTFVPSMRIGSSLLTSLDQVVKMVALDFEGEMKRFLSLNQLLMTSR